MLFVRATRGHGGRHRVSCDDRNLDDRNDEESLRQGLTSAEDLTMMLAKGRDFP